MRLLGFGKLQKTIQMMEKIIFGTTTKVSGKKSKNNV